MKAFHLLINFWAQIAKAQRMFHKVIFGLQLFQVLVPWNLQISNGRSDCPLLQPTFHFVNEEWIFMRTSMSVLVQPRNCQRIWGGQKQSLLCLSPLPLLPAVSRRMAASWREPWNPLSKITMCRELGGLEIFYQWLFWGVDSCMVFMLSRGRGRNPSVWETARRSAGDSWEICLKGLSVRELKYTPDNPKFPCPKWDLPCWPQSRRCPRSSQAQRLEHPLLQDLLLLLLWSSELGNVFIGMD